MAWSTIRKATDSDTARLQAAARRFCNRHGIKTELFNDHLGAVEYHTSEDKRLARLWAAAVRRALRCQADGIAYGYVGCSVR